MRVMIVGGGLVASNLIELISATPEFDCHITLIERREDIGQHLANTFDLAVVHGDGTNQDVLERAGCKDVDAFVALTGRDEDNLIACQLAKRVFNVNSPICRVNNPKNLNVIKKLGIYNTFSSSTLLSRLLKQEIAYSGLTLVYDIPANTKGIVEFTLRESASVCGKQLKEVRLPRDSRVVLITHQDGEVELAQGESYLLPHDRIMMVCDHDDFDLIHETLVDYQPSESSEAAEVEG